MARMFRLSFKLLLMALLYNSPIAGARKGWVGGRSYDFSKLTPLSEQIAARALTLSSYIAKGNGANLFNFVTFKNGAVVFYELDDDLQASHVRITGWGKPEGNRKPFTFVPTTHDCFEVHDGLTRGHLLDHALGSKAWASTADKKHSDIVRINASFFLISLLTQISE